MPVMQCVACGMEARPKSYHPSSLRVEAGLWVVALLVGSVVGMFYSITGSATEASRDAAALAALTVPLMDTEVKGPAADTDRNRAALASVAAASAGAARVPEDNTTHSSLTVQLSTWVRGKIALFLRSAWWVLPIPILFSLWRQMSKRDGCPKCGSRELVPAPEEAWS